MEATIFVVLLAIVAFCIVLEIISALLKAPREIQPWETITGQAYVTDGDGIRVSGYTVRFTGLDAPEWKQPAKTRYGYWINDGKRANSALIQAIGGKYVEVTLEGYDKYGRILGSVTCNSEEVGAWLVRNGYAIAAYDDRNEHLECVARAEARGMWGHDVAYDPRAWRHR